MRAFPDPTAEATFASAKLRWEDVTQPEHAGWLDRYRHAIAVRHADIVPRLAGICAGGRYEVLGESAVVVRWSLGEGGTLTLAANLSGARVKGFPAASGRVIWREGERARERAGRRGRVRPLVRALDCRGAFGRRRAGRTCRAHGDRA
jgi:1,4-alpha-glucan branching enzyme